MLPTQISPKQSPPPAAPAPSVAPTAHDAGREIHEAAPEHEPSHPAQPSQRRATVSQHSQAHPSRSLSVTSQGSEIEVMVYAVPIARQTLPRAFRRHQPCSLATTSTAPFPETAHLQQTLLPFLLKTEDIIDGYGSSSFHQPSQCMRHTRCHLLSGKTHTDETRSDFSGRNELSENYPSALSVWSKRTLRPCGDTDNAEMGLLIRKTAGECSSTA